MTVHEPLLRVSCLTSSHKPQLCALKCMLNVCGRIVFCFFSSFPATLIMSRPITTSLNWTFLLMKRYFGAHGSNLLMKRWLFELVKWTFWQIAAYLEIQRLQSSNVIYLESCLGRREQYSPCSWCQPNQNKAEEVSDYLEILQVRHLKGPLSQSQKHWSWRFKVYFADNNSVLLLK